VAKKSGSRPDRDVFVQELLAEGGDVGTNVTSIAGLVGDSPRTGYTRLFTNPDLSECLDIPDEAIVRHQPLDRSKSPLGGSQVWVSSNATLIRTNIDTVDAESAFLQGDITQDVLPMAASSGDFNLQAGLLSTPVCTVVSIIATVSMALCTRNKTCARTCKNCPFTLQRTCICY
jgi:hypothetical protein